MHRKSAVCILKTHEQIFGADKDPREVHFALKARLFNNKNRSFLMFTNRIFQLLNLNHTSAKHNAIKRQKMASSKNFLYMCFSLI